MRWCRPCRDSAARRSDPREMIIIMKTTAAGLEKARKDALQHGDGLRCVIWGAENVY